MLSFNNDIGLKKQIIDDLNHLKIDDNVWKRSAITWEDTAASFVGHVLKSDDLNDWENLGLAKWLALTLDYFLMTTANLKNGVEANIALLEAIPVGKDIQKVGSQYLIELITHDAFGIRNLTKNEQLLQALDSIVEIQKQCLVNTDITPSTWRSLRKVMVENSQAFDEESLDYLISLFTEAAAWDPTTSRTTISDSLRIWGRIKVSAEPSSDWTHEHDNHFRALLQRLYDQEKAKQSEGNQSYVDVFKLLKQYEPDEYERFLAHRQWEAEQPEIFAAKSIKLLNELLSKS